MQKNHNSNLIVLQNKFKKLYKVNKPILNNYYIVFVTLSYDRRWDSPLETIITYTLVQCRSHDHIRHFHSLKLLYMLNCSQLSAKVKRRIRTAVVSSSALSEMMFWDLNFNVCCVYLTLTCWKCLFYEQDSTVHLSLIYIDLYYFYNVFFSFMYCSCSSLNNRL
jgi:hypothetical protein